MPTLDSRLKEIEFLGSSLDDLRAFPKAACQEAGYQLHLVQEGKEPSSWRPMNDIGAGVSEIKIKEDNGEFRVLYVAKFIDAVYVLHCFQKKTQATSKRDKDLAQKRYKNLIEERKS